MEENCAACSGAGTVTTDPLSGLYCCCECGVVVDDDSLGEHHQVGLVGERGGTFVAGDGAARPGYFAKKKMEALRRIRDMAAQLGLQPNDADQVEAMVDRATNGTWGSGRWFGALVGACAYMVVRKNRLPLTLVEVAYSTDCGIPELGRILVKLVKELDVTLPPEDPIVFLERLVLTKSQFKALGRDGARKIVSQCRVLLEWMPVWFVTTGRHVLPAAAAVLALVADANGIDIHVKEIASELHAPLGTSMKRLREIQTALVSTMKSLPGSNRMKITTRNISSHLCFILRYLETSSKLDKKRKRDAAVLDQEFPEKKIKHLPEESPVLPVSFIASRDSRCVRIVKAELAAQRIARAKRSLAGAARDEQKLSGLDWEDLVIESLLLRGATRSQIEQGYYQSVLADLMPGDGDEPISDDELAKYFHSKDAASLIVQQLKLKSILRGDDEI